MTKQEVIKYLTSTPGNTNPAVLSTILNEFGASDNKTEIELSATENKVYTPAEGKVYNKVTVNVPGKTEVALSATENITYTPAEGTVYNSVTVNVPAPTSDWTTATVTVQETSGSGGLDDDFITLPTIDNNGIDARIISDSGVFTVALYKGVAIGSSHHGSAEVVSGDCVISGYAITITGDCTISFSR